VERALNRFVLRVSAGFLVGALVFLATSLSLSRYYLDEERRLAAAGDLEGAQEAARLSVRLDPFDPEPLEAQSFLMQQLDRDEDAVLALEGAVARDPNNYLPHLLLANLRLSDGDLDDAIAGYRKVLELNPEATAARGSLAQALVRKGDLEGAKKEYEKLRDRRAITPQGLYDLGRIYVRTGEPEKGQKAIRQARRRTSAELKQLDGAEKARSEELIRSMDLAIADALVVQGKYERAIQVLSQSESEQAPALLQLVASDPEGYRESVVNSGIY
jgi:tetratricopeptide (TPR) repeat protein